MTTPEKPLDKNEALKAASDGLRGNIAQELAEPTDHFTAETVNLLKFHGMYQQDDRDKRQKTPDGIKKEYSLMLRGRIPGGRLTASQYAVWDDLASQYGSGSLRLTTRQSVQLHGVLKKNVKQTIRAINKALLSTIAACGDVVRNVTEAHNPLGRDDLAQLAEVSDLLSDHFKPRSGAYAEIWLDDQLQHELQEEITDQSEPIYGETYLPRKFKIGVTLAGDNGIDLYTNDMGFAATIGENGKIDGYFVFAGGGLGMSHNRPTTFPRVADLLGWVPAEALIPIAEGIVIVQRDHGDRTNRKHARLKYLIHDRGVDWFRSEVESRAGVQFDVEKKLPEWNTPSYLGWQRQANGKTWALGFHTLSGRIIDRPGYPLKSALREIITTYDLNVQITADQDLILLGITDEAKAAIENRLAELGINPESPATIYDRALACPALPTCGLAITESERYLPNLLPELQKILDELNLAHKAPVVRMTGCPNGCARPYSAEIGIVGRTLGAYAVFVGGDPEGTRIGDLLNDNVKAEELADLFRKLFRLWKTSGRPEESFGDFTHRVPVSELQRALA